MRADLVELDDSELLARARSGDDPSSNEFAKRHSKWAIALAWRSGAGNESRDIVQEVLAKMLTGDTQPILHTGCARAYMHTAIVRRARALAEAKARRVAGPDDQWPNEQTSITGRLARADDQEALRRKIAILPPYQQDALKLRLEGLDNGEIAEALGRNPGVVRVYLSRAIDSIRRSFSD